MNYKEMSQEQMKKAAELKTPEEILEFAKAEGIELSDEQLDHVAGGKISSWDGEPIMKCPDCGSKNVVDLSNGLLQCKSCYTTWFRD